MDKTPVRILAIDDSELDSKYLQLFFRIKKIPADLHIENNPREALDYLKKLDRGEFPQVILVDIKMPFMDGFEFVEHYRNAFGDNLPSTLIFITSASIQMADRERAEKNDLVASFLEKPLTKEVFEEHILARLQNI